MTAPASEPDGTDPRILTPDDDEPEVKIANGYSTGKTYHTADCAVVKRMDAAQTVTQSVAEWKGYTKCKRCDEREGGEGYPHPGGPNGATTAHRLNGVGRIRCLQLRARLVGGETHKAVADAYNIGSATVGRHARGECSCEHHGRTLTGDDGPGHTPVEDEGVPRRITGRAPIEDATCADIRRALAGEGLSASALATVLGVSEGAVRRHGAGECTHAHPTPPVAYDDTSQGWVQADATAAGVGDD